MVRDNLMSRYGRTKQIFVFEVNFEQPEHPKHPYFYTLNCSIVTVVSLANADSHITISFSDIHKTTSSVKLHWPIKQRCQRVS